MPELRFTLVSDGSSDRALVRVLYWLLVENGVRFPVRGSWADLWRLRTPPKGLQDRIGAALQFYPCDLLFIHRDAEKRTIAERRTEIVKAVCRICEGNNTIPPALCVIPVRMTEAWFLFSESALRLAAGNPNGIVPLDIPAADQIETIPNPKQRLYDLIMIASGLGAHRRTKLRPEPAVHRLADIIADYSPLRALPAFAALNNELRGIVQSNGWDVV